MGETVRALLVDGDPEFADRVASSLARDHDLSVETAGSARAALDRIEAGGVDCVVAGDPGGDDGLALFERVREADPGVPFVCLAGGDGRVGDALDAGVDDCAPRPDDPAECVELAARIRRAVRRRDTERALERSEARYRRLVRRAPVPVVVYTDDGIVFPNDAALEFFGVEGFGPLVGRDPADALGAGEDLAAKFAAVLRDREGFGPVEHRFVADDGTDRVARLSVTPSTHGDDPAGQVVVDDLSEVRRTTDRLRRERRVADVAFEAFEGVAYVAQEGRLVRWNDRLAAVSGRGSDDLDGTPLRAVVDPGDDRAPDPGDRPGDAGVGDCADPDGRADAARRAFEGHLLTADGDRRPVAVREVPLADDRGRPAGRVGIGWVADDPDGDGDEEVGRATDDGYRRARERRLDRLRTVVRNVPVSLFAFDADGTLTLAEGESLSALGIDPAAGVGRSVPAAVAGHDALRSACERALDGEAAEATVDAGDRAVEVRLQPVEGGAVVGTALDVTDRRERERELERYRTLVEAAGDAMYALDREGVMTMVNEAQTEFAGADREELLGTHVGEYMRPEDVERGTEAILGLLEDDERDVARFEIRGEGDRFPGEGETVYEDIVAVLTDEDGEFRGSVGVLRDVTERKRRERELRRKNERLEEFASVVAHDLRGPLSVAYSDLEVALAEGDDDRIRDALASLDRVDGLLADLLTLARQGATVDATEPVDVGEVAREAWGHTDTAGATLRVGDPGTVAADPSRLRELFENLFRNSVEHAGEDVAVRVGSLADRPGFFVADDGPGIPPGEREAVFEHGYTVGEGTGLGLAIVDGIARAHGWAVSVTDSAGGGARFEVEVPDDEGSHGE